MCLSYFSESFPKKEKFTSFDKKIGFDAFQERKEV